MRLDAYLVQEGLVESREKAQRLIKEGAILLAGKVALKPSLSVSEGEVVELLRRDSYVGRAAWKLRGYLDDHPEISLQGLEILDIGSSTGGFAQVALEAGAARVVCVDVGREQLHDSLRKDPRIALFEGVDIRDFDAPPFDLVMGDLSFISLSKILPSVARLCTREALLLFKPQFEVGRTAKRNRKGVVVDQRAIEARMAEFWRECEASGFTPRGYERSKILGKEGNEEFFLHLWRV